MLQNPIKGIINELCVNSLTYIDAIDSDINCTAPWVDHDSANSLDDILAFNRLFNTGADYVTLNQIWLTRLVIKQRANRVFAKVATMKWSF